MRRQIRHIAILVIYLLNPLSSIYATDRFLEPWWSATCTIGPKKIEIKFISKSGHAEEDDMSFELKIDGKLIPVNSKPALFTYESFKKIKRDSLCNRLPAAQFGQNLLLFFALDHRPTLDKLAAILIDTKNDNVLDSNFNLGAIYRSGFELEKLPGGVRVKLNQGWRQNGSSDGPENLLSGWKKIEIHNSKISQEWEKALPSNYKNY